jgi:hypothetical protein
VLFYRRDYVPAGALAMRTAYYRALEAMDAEDLPEIIDDGRVINDLAENDVCLLHVALDPLGQRGNSLLSTVIGWADQHGQFMEDRLSLVRSLSRFTHKLAVQGGATAVSERCMHLARGTAPCSIWVENPGAELSMMPRDTGAAAARDDGWRVYYRWDYTPEQVEKTMKDYVLTHHTSDNLATLIDQVLSQGGILTSTLERTRVGMELASGMSWETDLRNGVGDYVFTRIRRRSQVGSENTLVFKIRHLARQDAISFSSDWVGGNSQIFNPAVSTALAKSPLDWKSYSTGSSNETLLKKWISILEEIEETGVDRQTDRNRLIAVFNKHGIAQLPDGRKIEDVIR